MSDLNPNPFEHYGKYVPIWPWVLQIPGLTLRDAYLLGLLATYRVSELGKVHIRVRILAEKLCTDRRDVQRRLAALVKAGLIERVSLPGHANLFRFCLDTAPAARPAVLDTARPAVLDTARPAVLDTARPAVLDTAPAARPAVLDTARPAVLDTARPAVLDTAQSRSASRNESKLTTRARVRAGAQAREAPTLDALVAASGSARSPCSVVRALLAEATDAPGWPVDRWHAELLEMARKPLNELDRVLDALERDDWVRAHPIACTPSFVLDRWEHYAAMLKPPTRAPAPPALPPPQDEGPFVTCPPELAEVLRLRRVAAR